MTTNPSWQFCGYTLKWTAEGGLDVANAFGVSNATDSLEGFDAMFAKLDARYEVLDLCIHEVSVSVLPLFSRAIRPRQPCIISKLATAGPV